MKRFWPRILSAFSTLAVGLAAASIARLLPTPVVKVQPPCGVIEVKVQPTPVLVPEIKQPPPSAEAAARPPEDTARPHTRSISPYEIKRLAEEDELNVCNQGGHAGHVEFEPVSKRLGLKLNGRSASFLDDCGSPSAAFIYTLELDGKAGAETLLRLDFGEPYATLYLIFKHIKKPSARGWRLLDLLPYFYGAPFVPPTHRVAASGTQRWLVIDHPTGHGAGFGSGADDWYDVDDRGVRKVLSYQNGLYRGFFNPDLTRQTEVSKIERRDGAVAIVLTVSSSYEGLLEEYRDPVPLWTGKRRVTFIRRPGMRDFILDTRHSELPRTELDPDYTGDESDRDFLKYNYLALARLAKGNAKQREWLRNYLENRDESREKQSLLRVLRGEQP